MESTPLLFPSNASGDSRTKGFYFLGKDNPDYQGGTTDSVRDAHGGSVAEGIPDGATPEEFAPRDLGPAKSPRQVTGGANQRSSSGGFWSRLFGKKKESREYGDVATLIKMRKAPIKVEPKVFFANERTFLAWMHLSVILAGASIAILAFAEESNPFSQLYGVVMLPVAISFIIYAMYQYARRASMIRHRHPGPYEDTTGPTVLAIMLMISILAQFSLKLYSLNNNV